MYKENLEVIVIVKLYVGSYLDKNLGGEAINFLQDDLGRNYIYIPKSGLLNEKYEKKVKHVIMARHIETNCFEVIGYAEIDSLLYKNQKELKLLNEEECLLKNEEFIKSEEIKYGEILLSDIFKQDNEFKIKWATTFKASKVLIPNNKRIYIFAKNFEKHDEFNNNAYTYYLSDKDNFGSQSLINYVDNINHKSSFESLIKMINRADNWTISDKKFEPFSEDDNQNFLQVIGKEYDENIYSNYFAYIFRKYPDLLGDFFIEVLNLKEAGEKIKNEKKYTVKRECDHIDLLISYDKNKEVIIENKIKSGINYSSADNKISQLIKYKEKHENQNYFIFLPDYNDLTLNDEEKSFIKIKYSEIYNFFNRQSYYNNDIYFTDFVKSLKIHTEKSINHERDMIIRFNNFYHKAKKKNIQID